MIPVCMCTTMYSTCYYVHVLILYAYDCLADGSARIRGATVDCASNLHCIPSYCVVWLSIVGCCTAWLAIVLSCDVLAPSPDECSR